MKRSLIAILFSAVTALTVQSALAGDMRLLGVGFGAPELDGTAAIPNPETGAIILDSSGPAFKGFDGTAWQTFSGGGPTTTPTVQKFTSGSGTYTTPAGTRYIRVRMVGGGGGGGGSATSSANNGGTGGTGGTTSFGSILSCDGGAGGAGGTNSGVGGAGGAVTVNSPAVATVSLPGARGGSATQMNGTGVFYATGAAGGNSPFGSAGGSSGADTVGNPAHANTGSGGGGGSGGSTAAQNGGAGGGSGGYIEALISNPSATYAYSVGAAGTVGTAGTSGRNGGAGGSGVIIVEEFY
ncbi:MAG: hypothetical protein KF799_06095 [Bdellovibrionales bacterium]|nr:hypothetical protein [Bdellovibrionales bacterium]